MEEKPKKSGENFASKLTVRARNEKIKQQVVELYLRGLSGVSIKSHLKEHEGLNVGINKITGTINKEIAIWVKQKNDLIENLKANELAKVNRLEFEYWHAWLRSCGDTTTKTTEKTRLDTPLSKKEEKEKIEIAGKRPKLDISKIAEQKRNNAGDPRFLDGIQWCVETRCKLLGLDAIQATPPGTPQTGATIVNIQRVVFTTKAKEA